MYDVQTITGLVLICIFAIALFGHEFMSWRAWDRHIRALADHQADQRAMRIASQKPCGSAFAVCRDSGTQF